MGKTIIIADRNQRYLQRLREFFIPAYETAYDFVCCCDTDQLIQALQCKEIALAVLDQKLLEDSKSLLAGVPVMILMEQQDTPLPKNIRGILKYQRRDRLFACMEQAASDPSEYILFTEEKQCELFLFQAASGGTGCSIMAAACSKALAAAGKEVLYLNLEANGTAGFYFRGDGNGSILQFLQQMRTGIPIETALGANRKRDESGVSFLDSARSVLEQEGLDTDMLLKLLARMKEKKLFDYIIIDKPLRMDERHAAWLDGADQVIFVENGSDVGNLKFARTLLWILDRKKGDKELIEAKCSIVYNMVVPDNFRELSHFKLYMLGRVMRMEHTGKTEIEHAIAESKIFTVENLKRAGGKIG